MKLLVCESCDAEFSIKHNMDKRLYKIEHCPFCGEQLNEEMDDLESLQVLINNTTVSDVVQ